MLTEHCHHLPVGLEEEEPSVEVLTVSAHSKHRGKTSLSRMTSAFVQCLKGVIKMPRWAVLWIFLLTSHLWEFLLLFLNFSSALKFP